MQSDRMQHFLDTTRYVGDVPDWHDVEDEDERDYAWDESKHPRESAGSERGGEFTSSNGFADAPTEGNLNKWRKAAQDRYTNDPEFRAAVDALTLFTQGEFNTIRAIDVYQQTGEWPERYKGSYLSEDGALDRVMSGNPLGEYKSYFEGQDVDNGSQHTWKEGVQALRKQLATAPKQKEFYRGVYGVEAFDAVKDLQPGHVMDIVGPTSFTSDRGVAEKFSENMASGQGKRRGLNASVPTVVFEVEAGARGIPVAAISPWKQKEVVSNGKFEVVSVKVEEIERAGGRGYWTKAERAVVRLRQK